MLDLNHLSHFVAVAHHRHFRRAARAVHLSPSALSRSIQALEAAVGQPLLMRSRAGVELTAHGRLVAEHGETLLRERQLLIERLARLEDGTQARLRVGAGAFPAEIAGVEAVSGLVDARGSLACQLRIGDFRQVTQDLLARRIDLGFCDLAAAREDSRIRCIPSATHQLFGYVRPGHPLLCSRPSSPRDVFAYPIIGVRAPLRILVDRSIVHHDFDETTGEVIPALNTASPALALKLLSRSDAVAFATLSMVDHLLADGRVVLVPLRHPDITLEAGFIHLADREPEPLALRFMQEVEQIEARESLRNRELEAFYGVSQD